MEGTNESLIKEISLAAGAGREGKTACDMLVFVTGGNFMLKSGNAAARTVTDGDAFFAPVMSRDDFFTEFVTGSRLSEEKYRFR